MKQGQFKIIYVDGSEKDFNQTPTLDTIYSYLGVKAIDCVVLGHENDEPSTVMLVDDTGLIDGKPVNKKATKLLREHYPNAPYAIHGDVAIVNDNDFGKDIYE